MIRFQNITNSSGISFAGFDHGAAWGDFNKDTLPDLWTSNHFSRGTLYLNEGDGSFTDITSDVFTQSPSGDTHGAAWADFDNDGDLDLIQLVGAREGRGSDPNRFYVNQGGILVDRASQLGVDYPLNRGRTPLWLDYNQDGLLDLVVSSKTRPDGQAPPTIFRQNDGVFKEDSASTNFQQNSGIFASFSDLSGDGKFELIADLKSNSNPVTIYDTSSIPFQDITDNIIPSDIGGFEDIAAADFNGDLLIDLYLTSYGLDGRSDIQEDKNKGIGVTLAANGDEKGAQFETTGNLTFQLGRFNDLSKIFIGSEGINPSSQDFTLSPNNPSVRGIFDHRSGIDEGVYIGYDPTQQRWQILFSSPTRNTFAASIQASESIRPNSLTAIGFDPDIPPKPDRFLINTGQGFVDQSEAAGISDLEIAGRNVIAADFDNDIDVDIYLVATGEAGNRPNTLLENQGDGTFISVSDTGGAAGTLLGSAGAVATADYDLDGFLDLFVLNGNKFPPPHFEDGPYQLFRNQGNDNHWLEIDLEGVASNRDGIGTTVLVTVDGITQIREQGGGIHRQTQNHSRLHFGLADKTIIDEIEVRWPTGVVQKIANIPADQLIRIVEPSGAFAPGQPDFSVGKNEGVFLWKDTFDGPYHLRTVGSGDLTRFKVNLITTDEPLKVTPFSVGSNDRLEITEFGFILNSRVISEQDGVDFQLAPGAKGLISVTQDGIANPRQLSVGNESSRLAPTGWILESDEFPRRPSFTAGEDLGLFVGSTANPDVLQFRWTGDRNFHRANLTAIASNNTANFVPSGLNNGGAGVDRFTPLDNGIEIDSNVGTGVDGLNVNLTESVQLGFSYKQDDLFQSHYVNPFNEQLGLPNAYELPLATPYGQPEYNASQDKVLFLWQDEISGVWELRATAGGGSANYVGSIVADLPVESVLGVGLESNDILDTSNPLQIDFNLRVSGSGQDGITFQFPDGADLSFNLEGDSAPLRIGSNQWRVSEVPLDLSGW